MEENILFFTEFATIIRLHIIHTTHRMLLILINHVVNHITFAICHFFLGTVQRSLEI